MELIAGELWWAAPDPSYGREQAGRRPVLIISNELFNETVTALVLTVPLTTTDRGWPNHVKITSQPDLPHHSFAMTEQVRAISRERLIERIGTATDSCLHQVRDWIIDYLSDRPHLLTN